MGLREYFQQHIGKGAAVTSGIILLAFAVPAGVLAMIGLVRSLRDTRAVFGTIVLSLLSWGLVLLALRLLRGRPESGTDSLSPAMLIVGAFIFIAGGLLLLVRGIMEHDVLFLLWGAAVLPASYFSGKFALERRKRDVPPNTSLERTRER